MAQNDLEKVWASAGDVVPTGDAKYDLGWVSEKPSYQEFNYVLNNVTGNILALAEGTLTWQPNISYKVGARVFGATGFVYTAIQNSLGVDPTQSSAAWSLGTMFGDVGASLDSYGVFISNVYANPSTSLWNGSDISIKNENPVTFYRANSNSFDNWLLGNIQGEMCVVNIVGTTGTPDGRDIRKSQAGTYRIYHEGFKPTQSDVSGTVPNDNPPNGITHGRKNQAWVETLEKSLKASVTEIANGSEDTKYITSAQLFASPYPGTKATSIDVDNGIDNKKFITPQALMGSTFISGIRDKASSNEVTTGTDNAKYITPAALAGSGYGNVYQPNEFRNGSFNIWQRGISFTGINSASFVRTADGVGVGVTSSDTISLTRTNSGQVQLDGVSHTSWLDINISAGGINANLNYLEFDIQNSGKYSGMDVSVSYWMKEGQGLDVTNSISVVNNDVIDVVAPLPTTTGQGVAWVKYSQTVTMPAYVGSNTDGRIVLRVGLASNVGRTVQMAALKVELSPVPTQFITNSYATDLAWCQTFYKRLGYYPFTSVWVSGQGNVSYLESFDNLGGNIDYLLYKLEYGPMRDDLIPSLSFDESSTGTVIFRDGFNTLYTRTPTFETINSALGVANLVVISPPDVSSWPDNLNELGSHFNASAEYTGLFDLI